MPQQRQMWPSVSVPREPPAGSVPTERGGCAPQPAENAPAARGYKHFRGTPAVESGLLQPAPPHTLLTCWRGGQRSRALCCPCSLPSYIKQTAIFMQDPAVPALESFGLPKTGAILTGAFLSLLQQHRQCSGTLCHLGAWLGSLCSCQPVPSPQQPQLLPLSLALLLRKGSLCGWSVDQPPQRSQERGTLSDPSRGHKVPGSSSPQGRLWLETSRGYF